MTYITIAVLVALAAAFQALSAHYERKARRHLNERIRVQRILIRDLTAVLEKERGRR